MLSFELVDQIGQTLDQLIENATAVHDVSFENLSDAEKEAFDKTQESLIAHLLFMDKKLEEKREQNKKINKRSCRYKIEEKLSTFQKLDQERKINSYLPLEYFAKKTLAL